MLSFESFNRGVQYFVFYEVTDDFIKENHQIDYRSILFESVQRARTVELSILRFANELEEVNIMEHLHDYQTNIWLSPLFNHVDNDIIRGRAQFAHFLQYLSERFEDNQLKSVITPFKKLESDWNIIKAMLLKLYYSNGNSKIKMNLSQRLQTIAKQESEVGRILENALNFINSNVTLLHSSVIDTINDNLIDRTRHKKSTFVDLGPIRNNIGLSASKNAPYRRGDLTGTQECFVFESSIQYINIESLEFSMPDLRYGEQYDNVSCTGQLLELQPDYYDGIAIMGCAEYLHADVQFNIIYSNGTVQSEIMHFPDWWNSDVDAGSYVAWSGNAIKYNQASITDLGERYLVAHQRSLDSNNKVVGLELPDNPNIHIFSVTLYNYI